MNQVWNCAETRPTKGGVYRTLSEGIEGFSLYDATDRIWGCTHPTPELARDLPDFEYALQFKHWVEVSDADVAS